MRVSTNLAIAAGLLCAVASSSSLAFQPLITDDTGTQGVAGNQIEFSFNRDRETSAGNTSTTRTLPVTFTRGLTDALDVFVSANHTRVSSSAGGPDASGSGNPSLGLKWRFYASESGKTSLGIKPELRLPVSAGKEAAALGTGRVSYGATLLFTQETPFGAVHANLEAGHDRYRNVLAYPDPDTSTTRASVAPVWDIGEQWKLALDLGTTTQNCNGREDRFNYLELGAIFSPDKDLEFALGILRRTNNDSPDISTRSITAGITWRFK